MMNRVGKLYEEAKAECERVSIPFAKSISIQISSRMTSTFGKCSKKRDEDNYVIKISSLLKDFSDEAIKDVIIHELLHTCPGCMNHGKQWLSYARKINDVYGYEISQYVSKKEEQHWVELQKGRSKYKVECQKCKKLIFRDRLTNVVKYPERYTCICGGSLKRIP